MKTLRRGQHRFKSPMVTVALLLVGPLALMVDGVAGSPLTKRQVAAGTTTPPESPPPSIEVSSSEAQMELRELDGKEEQPQAYLTATAASGPSPAVRAALPLVDIPVEMPITPPPQQKQELPVDDVQVEYSSSRSNLPTLPPPPDRSFFSTSNQEAETTEDDTTTSNGFVVKQQPLMVATGETPSPPSLPQAQVSATVPSNEQEDDAELDDDDEYEEDEQQDGSKQWLEDLLQANSSKNALLGGRDLGVQQDLSGGNGQEPTSTETPIGYTVVKWTLIGVIVLIPIVLLPALFLFTRGNKFGGGADGDVGLVVLNKTIRLYPTAPAHLDACLVNASGDFAKLVHKDAAGELHYKLNGENCVLREETGQLLDIHSGILFNPVPRCTYDRGTHRLTLIKKTLQGEEVRVEHEPNSNLVFDEQSFAVYERCFALSYQESRGQADESGIAIPNMDQDGSAWKLPRSPATHQPQRPIRRVRVNELPTHFRPTYEALLALRLKAKGMATPNGADQQTQPPNATEARPSPILSELEQMEAPKLKQSDGTNSNQAAASTEASKQQPNPLVLDQRDFSGHLPEDSATSPRGGEADASLKLPVGNNQADPLSPAVSPRVQPTVYGDAKSQVA